MHKFWWQLPGPNWFLSCVVQDIQDGKNVMLCLPEHLPEGITHTVRVKDALNNGRVGFWHTFHADRFADVEPAHFLRDRLTPRLELSNSLATNAQKLAEDDMVAGKVVWVQGLNHEVWPQWKAFIVAYATACQAVPLASRTVICFSLVGELALEPPKPGPCLVHRHWHSVVDHFDMALFTSYLLPKTLPLNRLQRHLVVSIIAELAMWDSTVSERLVEAFQEQLIKSFSHGLARIMDPLPILQSLAHERGWNEHMLANDGWHRGMIDTVEGDKHVHSSMITLDDASGLLSYRVWRAQTRVLLPFLEECRQELLADPEFACHLIGKVDRDDVQSLDIDHIAWQIHINGTDVSDETRQRIMLLQQIYDQLAHRTSPSVEQLVALAELLPR